MKLTQNELEIIRNQRIDAYKKRTEKHLESFRPHVAIVSFYNDLQKIANSITEVEQELDKQYPKWDDCPF